ncbi:MAG: VOC family protein [Hyphomonadaceae bacterium]
MIRYGKLGFVELNVTDLTVSLPFYRDIVGLELVREEPGRAFFRCDADEYSVILTQASPAGMKCAGWSLESDAEFENLLAQLNANGARREELSSAECKERGFTRAIRAAEPHSNATLVFFRPAKQGFAFTKSHTSIQRLGHVVWGTPNREAARDFFRDVLNFRESDHIGEVVTFMRPFPNPYHHGIGIGSAPKHHFHHLNFMVTEIDDIGRAIHRFNKNNVPIVYGPGRHPASGSVFLYFLEPDGMTLEYSFGMEEFDEHAPRAPITLPMKPESVDYWGSPRDPRFASTGVMEMVQIA